MTGLRGEHFVAGAREAGHGEPFTGIDPLTGTQLAPDYREASGDQIDRAAAAAGEAAAPFAACEPGVRAQLLRAIGDGLMALGDDLVQRIGAETALPKARVEGERGRTVLQLQQFAALLEQGSWVDARIDRGEPARQPVPKPDLRRMLVALGPVAVFGASNFPLAYSVAGGDTASALAAGCPVVVKAHPAHPGTSELVGRVITEVVARQKLPPGTFSLVHGRTPATGARLVQHPAIAAVGFTGSHQGGRALFDLAAARPRPIPVFAEMGSMNPVFILPRALAARGAQIAEQLAASATLASGQFCTSPGMVLWAAGDGADPFAQALRERLGAAAPGPTVHTTIRSGYERALAEVQQLPVAVAATSAAGTAATSVCPTLLRASADVVLAHERLRTEIFGPAVLAVPCAAPGDLLAIARSLHGHLTATVHGDGDDFVQHAELLAVLRTKVGRLIANGVPTGVEVCGAMVHGGPYPAATDARFSAVGTTSIQRWVRPVCWQDWPHDLLPPELRDDNPRGIRRTVDGVVG
ncbi:MAG TPA: aldehyde dehydrogenase (NADP(+)) [Planctomycetota bacterium]|nr:aldehyde dehydrogenase (NADP(+)) [Planctomycetota bacterium]